MVWLAAVSTPQHPKSESPSTRAPTGDQANRDHHGLRPGLNGLRDLMDRLLSEQGCPWDREQTLDTLRPYLIEEAYEVSDAIEREAWDELKSELGDLLFQSYFHAQMAEDVNATATKHIATLAKNKDVPLVYISTAGVFDGKKTSAYTEADQPIPIMVYGQTKYDGEEFVRAICEKYYVIRAGWMVGGGMSKDHKFVHKMLDQILEGKKTLHAVDDKLGTPTYTHDFAMNLFKLLAVEAYGTYHMVCEGSGSRYDVAKELVRLCGLEDEIELVAVDSDFFKDVYFAPRPRSEMTKPSRASCDATLAIWCSEMR